MPGLEAVSASFLAWRSRLARIVSRIVPPHDVEDIVQETYVRACQFAAKEEIKSPGTFMARIIRNLALDHLRRAHGRLTTSIDDEIEAQLGAAYEVADEPFQQVASDEEFACFCEAVRQLPVQCRKVFVLKKVYGHSQQEIAKELSISENTVEKLVAAGIRQCVHHMRRRQERVGAAPVVRGPQSVRVKEGRRR